MTVNYKNRNEIESLRKSALMVGDTLSVVAEAISTGITTMALDRIAEEYIRDHGAIPTFKGYGGFPASLCISINDHVVHGIPSNIELKDGDVVSIDCGVTLDGWVGDSAYTFAVGEVDQEVLELLRVTKQALYQGISVCKTGNRVGDIGYAIQSYCESFGYGVVRELCGHGLGKKMHENPSVPNYGKRGTGIKMREGLVIAIEPMITLGEHAVVFESDGWTCRTKDGRPAAHYEHDVAITNKGEAEILSSFQKVEQAEEKNINLHTI